MIWDTGTLEITVLLHVNHPLVLEQVDVMITSMYTTGTERDRQRERVLVDTSLQICKFS